MKKIFLISVSFVLILTASLFAQEKKQSEKTAELLMFAQFWGTHQITDQNLVGEVDSRNDLYIRRGRLGVKGKLSKMISYKVWLAYDKLGRDNYVTPFKGKAGEAAGSVVVWDAYFTFKFNPAVNLMVGYFRPQTSRESIRSAYKIMLYEKPFSNSVHRKYTVVQGSGRAEGLDLSGKFKNKAMGIKYNAGLFNSYEGGVNTSFMYAGRLAFWYGDEEKKYMDNHFFKRNGTTVAVYATQQSAIDQNLLTTVSITDTSGSAFNVDNAVQSLTYGADILANYGGFSFKAEYSTAHFLELKGDGSETGDYSVSTWDAVVGYTFRDIGPGLLEPSIGYAYIEPDEALSLDNVSIQDKVWGKLFGKMSMMDFGVNYYLNKNKLKFTLHYLKFTEDKTEYDNDYLGAALQIMY